MLMVLICLMDNVSRLLEEQHLQHHHHPLMTMEDIKMQEEVEVIQTLQTMEILMVVMAEVEVQIEDVEDVAVEDRQTLRLIIRLIQQNQMMKKEIDEQHQRDLQGMLLRQV